MNEFSLQSTTTPRKACKDLSDGLKISAWWSLIGASG
ncbi:unnamed protein product [Prunus brigantina]